ncbi:MAG: nicotinamide-nucleotide amidase [Methylophagaceae bacterium]
MTDILEKVSKKLHENNLSLVSAESCTGGWVAKQLTDLAGSSAIFDRGFITYSNQAKQDMLGVSLETLDNFGAVSEQVVIEMVEGALANSQADIALSISGIAGPDGGTVEKPIGTVCFGWMKRGEKALAKTVLIEGDRDKVRKQAVNISLTEIIKLI